MHKALRSPRLQRIFMATGLGVLAITTVWWAWLGAQVQQGSADQLVDGFLFGDASTFHGAYFPASHTQLFKWPLFNLLSVFHYSADVFTALTIAVCLLTVATLAYVLYRIERRPMVFGGLCFVLAASLFAVPALVFAGSTSPLNMAMLTNRNLEYIVYLGCLVLLVRVRAYKSWQFASSVLLLTLLIASDRLFAGLSIGGALVGLLFFAAAHKKIDVMVRWLAAGVLAFLGAAAVLWLLNHTTHIVNDGTNIYGTAHTVRAVAQGSWQVLVQLVTNFGGNVWGLAVLATVCLAVYKVVQRSLAEKVSQAHMLALMLIATTIAALLLFVGTQQPYQLDGRYLTIALFAGFITLAVYLRAIQPAPPASLAVGAAAAMYICVSIPSVLHTTAASQNFGNVRVHNAVVAQALRDHPVDVLVGNYWRVVPIKSLHPQQRIVPLGSCMQARGTLTSQTWQLHLPRDSFAYLLSVKPTPGMASCSPAQIIRRFGKPLSTQIIAGTPQHPEELLLFYNFSQNAPQRNLRPLPFLR